MVELAGVPRPNSGAGHRVGDQNEIADFLLHIIRNAESIDELKDLETHSLVMNTSNEQSTQDVLLNSWPILPVHELPLSHRDDLH